MATRTLTKAFVQARNGGKANRSLMKADSDETSDSGLLNVSKSNQSPTPLLCVPWRFTYSDSHCFPIFIT